MATKQKAHPQQWSSEHTWKLYEQGLDRPLNHCEEICRDWDVYYDRLERGNFRAPIPTQGWMPGDPTCESHP